MRCAGCGGKTSRGRRRRLGDYAFEMSSSPASVRAAR
jgi:hypothetical protein